MYEKKETRIHSKVLTQATASVESSQIEVGSSEGGTDALGKIRSSVLDITSTRCLYSSGNLY